MTIEKIKQIALEKHGKTLTDEQAAKYAEKYANKSGKLSDDELDSVSGGYTCEEEEYWYGKYCEPCGVWCDKHSEIRGRSAWVCPVCKTLYE